MRRDPQRIDQILGEIRRIWEKNPDQRLLQLLVNANLEAFYDITDGGHCTPVDPFYYEDDKLLQRLRMQ